MHACRPTSIRILYGVTIRSRCPCPPLTPPRRSKRAPNLSIDVRLFERARRLKSTEWLRKNRAALEAYNKDVEKHGVFSDGMRSF